MRRNTMLIDAFRALQAGKELARAESWKRAQVWTSNLTILLSAGVGIAAAMGHPIPLTPEQITTVVSAVAVLVGLFNSYVTVATTTRLGVPSRADGELPGPTERSAGTELHGGAEDFFRALDDRIQDDVRDVK